MLLFGRSVELTILVVSKITKSRSLARGLVRVKVLPYNKKLKIQPIEATFSSCKCSLGLITNYFPFEIKDHSF